MPQFLKFLAFVLGLRLLLEDLKLIVQSVSPTQMKYIKISGPREWVQWGRYCSLELFTTVVVAYLNREVGLSIQSLSLSFTMSSTFKKVTRNLSSVGFGPQAKHNLLPKLTLMMMGLVIKLWTSIHPLQLPIKPLLHKSSSFGSVPLITISFMMSLWVTSHKGVKFGAIWTIAE